MALHQGTASLQTRRGGGFQRGKDSGSWADSSPHEGPRRPQENGQNEWADINVTLPSRPVQERQGGDALVAAFARWAADQRTAAAAGQRTRERSLREQATASATWTGILVDLAEQAALVTAVVAGRRRHGRVAGMGRDFCVLESEHNRTALIGLNAVSALWPEDLPASQPPTGDRTPTLDLSMMAALALLAEERAPVAVVTTDGVETAGDLLAVGEDVLTLRAGGSTRRLALVPRHAVAVCELR